MAMTRVVVIVIARRGDLQGVFCARLFVLIIMSSDTLAKALIIMWAC
jgi:hypothetical protein